MTMSDTKFAAEITVGDVLRAHGEVVMCVGERQPCPGRFGNPWIKYRAVIMAGKRKGHHSDVIFGPGAEVELVTWDGEATG